MLFFSEKSLYNEVAESFNSEQFLQCSPDSLFDSDDCVLTDVNLSEASEDNLGDYKNKFSYNSLSCLHSDGDSYPNSPINDMDTDFANGLIVNPSDVKVEPESPIPSPHSPAHVSSSSSSSTIVKYEPDIVIKQEQHVGHVTSAHVTKQTSVLKQPTIVITGHGRPTSTRLLVPKLSSSGGSTTVKLDSDRWRMGGGHRSGAAKIVVTSGLKSSTRRAIDSHLISSNTGSNGELYLTEEEKRTLVSEGYSIPKKLPLTKAEERSLKKIRRKIKNKISAQESRRKKKEYLDLLERKYEAIQEERDLWQSKCEELEMQNKELTKQLVDLKSQIIDFDEVDLSPETNFTNKPMEHMDNEIADPFEIDVD